MTTTTASALRPFPVSSTSVGPILRATAFLLIGAWGIAGAQAYAMFFLAFGLPGITSDLVGLGVLLGLGLVSATALLGLAHVASGLARPGRIGTTVLGMAVSGLTGAGALVHAIWTLPEGTDAWRPVVVVAVTGTMLGLLAWSRVAARTGAAATPVPLPRGRGAVVMGLAFTAATVLTTSASFHSFSSASWAVAVLLGALVLVRSPHLALTILVAVGAGSGVFVGVSTVVLMWMLGT